MSKSDLLLFSLFNRPKSISLWETIFVDVFGFAKSKKGLVQEYSSIYFILLYIHLLPTNVMIQSHRQVGYMDKSLSYNFVFFCIV